MSRRMSIMLHAAVFVAAVLGLWRFVFPDRFGEALGESLMAAAMASTVEFSAIRMKWWG